MEGQVKVFNPPNITYGMLKWVKLTSFCHSYKKQCEKCLLED